eukprot:87080-Prymnesium_polylepis.1
MDNMGYAMPPDNMGYAMPPAMLPAETMELVIEIPNGQEVNQLIGARGANINQLQQETGAHIAIQRASEVLPGVNVRRVTISAADPNQRQMCANRILGKVAEFQLEKAGAADPTGSNISVIEIPNGPE